MTKRSLWQQLWGWLRGQGTRRQRQLRPAPELLSLAGAQIEPLHLGHEEELWLETLSGDVGEGKRLDAIASESFWNRIQALWQRGHERLATEWLVKFIAVPTAPAPAVLAMRVRLIELLDKRNDLAAAVPHLEVLTAVEEHATRAHYLLGEHYRRQGDEARALRYYEAVLARDMAYPNVRERVDRLRKARGGMGSAGVGALLGETIAGVESGLTAGGTRYALIRELGRGGTGVVYLARDRELERDVAIKLLHPHLAAASQAEACARFFDEARISASLRHPNIVAVLDLDEQTRRIVMELAAGGTLRDVLRDRGPRPLRRALERHTQLLSALDASHRRGIVHRDIKPGNLMFRRDPDAPGSEIVLGDFGVAHLPDAHGATRAQAAEGKRPAEAVGTLAYMSPEQRRSEATGPRSDLYAAAVVLFEMLTGAPPWRREVLLSGVRQRGDFRLPDAVTNGIPRDLVDSLQDHLDRMGDPDPVMRPDTSTALEEARALRDRAIVQSLQSA